MATLNVHAARGFYNQLSTDGRSGEPYRDRITHILLDD